MIGTILVVMKDNKKAAELNEILHKNAENILGRMGVPKPKSTGFILNFIFSGEEEVFENLLREIKNISDIRIGYSKI